MIARRLGISKPTVSTALQVLLEAGLVREAETAIYPNYGAVFFEPDFDAAHVLAFDVGANEDLLLEPLRAALLPYPPAVETSSLGDSAVLMGALSLGLESALETVVERRLPPMAAVARRAAI